MAESIETRSAPARRHLATRHAAWAKAAARRLGRAGVRPNAVSLAGVAAAGASATAFVTAPLLGPAWRPAALTAAAACIQIRLLCNLLDGMLAVEEGLKSATGEIYNEVPDRIADILILVGAGCSQRGEPWGVALGWAAAVAAVFTAYVRVLAGSLGVTQHFLGPMAKQHRMFTLTVAALGAALEVSWNRPALAIRLGLALIVAGSVVTAWRRIGRLARELRATS